MQARAAGKKVVTADFRVDPPSLARPDQRGRGLDRGPHEAGREVAAPDHSAQREARSTGSSGRGGPRPSGRRPGLSPASAEVMGDARATRLQRELDEVTSGAPAGGSPPRFESLRPSATGRGPPGASARAPTCSSAWLHLLAPGERLAAAGADVPGDPPARTRSNRAAARSSSSCWAILAGRSCSLGGLPSSRRLPEPRAEVLDPVRLEPLEDRVAIPGLDYRRNLDGPGRLACQSTPKPKKAGTTAKRELLAPADVVLDRGEHPVARRLPRARAAHS